MATSLDNFTKEAQLGAGESALVSTTSTEKKFIGMMTLTNTSDVNVEITLWRISTTTAGTTGSGGNWVINETIPAKRTVKVSKLIGQVLGSSMKISGLAGTGAVVNVDISGTTET